MSEAAVPLTRFLLLITDPVCVGGGHTSDSGILKGFISDSTHVRNLENSHIQKLNLCFCQERWSNPFWKSQTHPT